MQRNELTELITKAVGSFSDQGQINKLSACLMPLFDQLTKVVEAASDFKMGLENEGFAHECGGIDKLRSDLFSLVEEWEGKLEEGCAE